MRLALIATIFVSALFAGQPARAGSQYDGIWKVLIVTESGTCDRGYQYNFKVADGRLTYDGDSGFSLAGTVAGNGAVKVEVSRGQQSARGTGRLSASNGTGKWSGRGSAGECAGYWEAERR